MRPDSGNWHIKRIFSHRLPQRWSSRFSRTAVEVGIGLAVALVATGLRLLTLPLTGSSAPYALVFAAVVVATVLGGWRAGAIAFLFAQAMALFLVVEPRLAFAIATPKDFYGFLLATAAQLLTIAALARSQVEIDHGQAESERQLAEVEARDRLLEQSEARMRMVLDCASDAFYAVDSNWRFTLLNHAAESYFGIVRGNAIGRCAWDFFPAARRSQLSERLERCMRDRRPEAFVLPSTVKSGLWIESRVSPTEDGGIAVSFTDVSDRIRAEQARTLLVEELNHRVKNTLAVVQSLCRHSLGSMRDSQEYLTFEGRLLALAGAHNLLTRRNWESATLDDAVAEGLRAFAGDDRIRWSGPPVTVTAKTAVNLILCFHELATNATKYGALSIPAGRVEIDWEVQDGLLHFRWQECDGPPVAIPDRRGFGTRMIERGLAAELGGTVEIDFAPQGLICRVITRFEESPAEEAV